MIKRAGFLSLWYLMLSIQPLLAHETPDDQEQGTLAAPPGPKVQQYVQSWLGAVDADDSWSLTDPETEAPLTGDFSSLPMVGGAGQRLWGERIQYGFEGGGLVGWKNDRVGFYGTNGLVRIRVDNSLFLFEPFFGGVVAVQPTNWMRLYAAAGPSIAWAYLDDEDVDDEDEEDSGNGTTVIGSGTGVVVNLEDGQDDFSFSVYVRAGLDFQFSNGFSVGVSGRYVDHEFDFNDRGKLAIDEIQWFLTFGQLL
ncbi:MAG: hypothetical protein ACR2PZ_26550 [Pseudomonadales bacterium]